MKNDEVGLQQTTLEQGNTKYFNCVNQCAAFVIHHV